VFWLMSPGICRLHDRSEIARDTFRRALSGELDEGIRSRLDPGYFMVERGWSCLHHQSTASGLRIVACSATLGVANPCTLTATQFDAVRLSALGLASKEVAAQLGIPAATARGTLGRALHKLGLRSVFRLPAFWHAVNDVALRLQPEPALEFLVFECSFALQARQLLTSAELSVLRCLLDGDSNRTIARKRQTSVNTVAHQVARIRAKYSVSSRAELVVKALAAHAREFEPAGAGIEPDRSQ
jgi:DNA-binding CsgD family transcriptional regulator